MSCWDKIEEEESNGTCPDCGEPTTDGVATVICGCSPIICGTCGAAPCDDSC